LTTNQESHRNTFAGRREAKNLLVADSCLEDRTKIAEAFSKNEWQVIHVASPVEAAELCVAQKFDVIFMEMDPLNPDCIDSLSEIRNGRGLSNHATIIANSGFTPGAFGSLAVRVGADIHVKKPIHGNNAKDYVSQASRCRLLEQNASDHFSIGV